MVDDTPKKYCFTFIINVAHSLTITDDDEKW